MSGTEIEVFWMCWRCKLAIHLGDPTEYAPFSEDRPHYVVIVHKNCKPATESGAFTVTSISEGGFTLLDDG